MNTDQIRVALSKKYAPSFVKKMSDAQAQAVYFRLKSEGKIT